MTSHVTRLEVENVELKHELEQIKSKLMSTQQEVETLLNQSEHDYNKRLRSGDTHRQEVERRYEARMSELREAISRKQGELETCEGRLCESERGRKGLERQLLRVEEQWQAATTKCEDLNVQSKQLHRELQETRRRIHSEDTQQLAVLKKDKEQLKQENKQLHRTLSESKRRINSLQNNSEQVAELQRDKEELLIETEQLHRELQLVRIKVESVQDNTEQLEALQRDKEELIQQLNTLHGQVSREKEQNISLQRDSNDFMQRLSVQQSHWDRDKEKCLNLEREKAQLQSENQQLKCSLDSLRDCSEEHIKQLEEQVAALQDKSVAIENLNDYLTNLSTVESSTQDVIDTDLDAHLDFSSVKDDNHNDKSMDTRVERIDWKSQEVAVPQCSSTPQSARRHVDNKSGSLSLCEPDEYTIDSSQLYGNDRPTKLTYIKRNASFTASSHEPERSSSNTFIDKLKSYVKPYKTMQSRGNESTEIKGHRTPLQEVQLREDRNFVRNSRHRSTVHGQSMVEKSPSLKREKLKTPVTHASSRPVSTPFSRGHSLRQTMPERRRPPDHRSGNSHNNSHYSLVSQDSTRSRSSSQSSCQPPATHCYNRDYSSDLDSGLGVSAEQAAGRNPTTDTKDGHSVTSIEVVSSSQTVKSSQWQQVSVRGDKCQQALMERIRRLEEQKQAVSRENSELKKQLESLGTGPSQKRLQQLEAENRKLRIIVETLQNTLSGRNPYDDKEYHYFTNV